MPIGTASALAVSMFVPMMQYQKGDVVGIGTGLACALAGSLLPDIDCNGESKAKREFRKILPVSLFCIGLSIYEELTGDGIMPFRILVGAIILVITCLFGYTTSHRGFTHQLNGLVCFVTGGVLLLEMKLGLWFGIGVLSHQIADMCNKGKILWLKPLCNIDFARYWFKADSFQAKVLGIVSTIITIILVFIALGGSIVIESLK